jgi:hypothetical protein
MGEQPPAPGGYPPPQAPGFPQDGYPVAPPPKKSNTALKIVGLVAVVFLLLCGAGIVAIALSDKSSDTADSPGADPSSSVESVQGNLDKFKIGDCLTISSTNTVKAAKCADTGALKVLLRKDGTTDDAACQQTEATQSLFQDGSGTTHDFVLCIGPAA